MDDIEEVAFAVIVDEDIFLFNRIKGEITSKFELLFEIKFVEKLRPFEGYIFRNPFLIDSVELFHDV